ncbi:hypothetical protein E8K88_11980 [Lampropedia aestuarii]|uniref:Uncharacterized protein n=1 Tax=Lampropedia aestuarii TaxID=2562762 RepID=A0A4V3YWS1_9BURK|nr:hypothetical protein [Lampropedia aestuarii]THJ32412.1 hypothetical protein E8K88_11980 [Lampropedia aestuarii]
MNKIAVIENRKVVNIIVATIGWAQEYYEAVDITDMPNVGIDYTYTEEGEFIPPEEMPVAIPDVYQITRRQGLIALFREEGVKDSDVQAIIDSIEDPGNKYEAQLEFMNAAWEISNPWVIQFATALGLTKKRLQELFNIADTL